MNWVDYIIIGIFFFSMLIGFSRGFVKEVISLAALIAAFIIASRYTNALATTFTSSASVQNAVNQASAAIGVSTSQPVSYFALGLSFSVLFFGTLIIGSIVGYVANIFFQIGLLGLGNRLLGGVFGLGRGFILNLVLIFLVQLSPLAKEVWWQQSQLVGSFQPAVVWLGNIVSPSLANLKAKLGQGLDSLGGQLKDATQSVGGVWGQ